MDTFFSLVSVFLIKGFHCIHGSFANVKFPICLRGVCMCVCVCYTWSEDSSLGYRSVFNDSVDKNVARG